MSVSWFRGLLGDKEGGVKKLRNYLETVYAVMTTEREGQGMLGFKSERAAAIDKDDWTGPLESRGLGRGRAAQVGALRPAAVAHFGRGRLAHFVGAGGTLWQEGATTGPAVTSRPLFATEMVSSRALLVAGRGRPGAALSSQPLFAKTTEMVNSRTVLVSGKGRPGPEGRPGPPPPISRCLLRPRL